MIIDSLTGSIVCTLDEVADISGGTPYKEKLAEVRERNARQGGVKLKYGIRPSMSPERKISLVPDEATHIPLFYLALSKEHIEKGIQEFAYGSTAQSDSEKKLFSYFIAAIGLQIKDMEVYAKHLDPVFNERLTSLKKVIEEIQAPPMKAKAAAA